jgi:hypothetical protein
MGRKHENIWRVNGEGYGKKNRRICGGLKVRDMGRKQEDMWRVKGE